jgi:uncharacterized protein YutE (UPF0331/DUF86 family)
MTNKERAAEAIGDIEGYFDKLEKLDLQNAECVKDEKDRFATSMILFSICNRAFELAEIIIREKKGRSPESYRDIFNVLYEEGFIDKDLKNKFSDLVHYRNAIAHEYQKVDENDLFNLYGIIDVVKSLVQKAKEELK